MTEETQTLCRKVASNFGYVSELCRNA